MFEQGSLLADPQADQQPAGELVDAAKTTIDALRDQHAIQAWHELDCAIVMETARGVLTSKGIAKSQMITALLAARAKLPEPVVQESDDAVQFEADRELAWIERHGDPADLPNSAQPTPVH